MCTEWVVGCVIKRSAVQGNRFQFEISYTSFPLILEAIYLDIAVLRLWCCVGMGAKW